MYRTKKVAFNSITFTRSFQASFAAADSNFHDYLKELYNGMLWSKFNYKSKQGKTD